MNPRLHYRSALALAVLSASSLLSPAPALAAELSIKRDGYGTPHIYANDTYGLFFGYGYAIAQDRLYQLEMARRSTQGRVAEVLGPDYIEFDTQIRQHYSPQQIREQLEQLPQADRDILEGYAAGINRWLNEIGQQPGTLMPKQFNDQDFRPQSWTAFDVAMVFIGSMINRFGDYNTELQNQQLLDSLIAQHGAEKGRALFDRLLATDDADAPTTIPKGDWNPDVRQPHKVAQNLKSGDAARQMPLLASLGGTLQLPNVEERPFSNIIVLGRDKTKGASAVLINGPQFGYYQPAYTYSIGLHGAGYDAVGNSPFGYPMVEFGYNDTITWGSTWGAGDNVDIFRLELNPDNPEEYRYQNAFRAFDKHTETIAVKGQTDVTITVYRSVYGPVVKYDPEHGVAFAKDRGWAGHEVETLIAWNKAGKARNHDEWAEQVAKSAINVNWYYADREGNIGYALGGRYPIRSEGQDGRLPTPGDGTKDWQGFMPFATNPQVYNPSSGYIANWNNRPAEGFPNPDQWWYAWHAADRVQALFTRLDAQPAFTPDEAWQVMKGAAFEDPNARFFVPRLLQAVGQSSDERLRDAARALQDWNYQVLDDDADGFYDSAATPIFRSWLGQMLQLTLGTWLPENEAPWFLDTAYFAPGSGSPGSQNISVGVKLLHQAIQQADSGLAAGAELLGGRSVDELMIEALKQAVDELSKSQGSDIAAWKTGIAHTLYSTRNFLAIPQAGDDEKLSNPLAMNRGTENNMTVLSSDTVKGFEVVPPGQSGFIAPDGTRSAHFDDQLELFASFKLKPTWLHQKDVDANTASTLTLEY